MQRFEDATLVMTVLNEASSLPLFLDSLMDQTALPSEVVITDGGSIDSTVEILQNWSWPRGVRVRVIELPGANISTGRNEAIRNSSNETIIITDAGTVLVNNWVENLVAAIKRGADVAAGFFQPQGRSWLERSIAAVITPHVDEVIPDTFLPSSRSVALRKSAWKQVEGYPEWLDYCEDLVFDLKLKESGAVFEFVPEAVASWNARPDLVSFFRQYFRYARGDGKAGLFSRRHFIRYSVYISSTAILFRSFRNPKYSLLLAVGFFTYMTKFWKRVYLFRGMLGDRYFKSLAIAPLIVVTGDLAKMLGYPAGKFWHYTNRLK